MMPQTAEALDEVHLQVLSAASFRSLRDAYREFDDALLRMMSGRMRMLSAYMTNTILADMPNRVALRLLEVARVDQHGELSIPMSQGALAMLIGASRQTINKILKQFEKDELVLLGYSTVKLLDINSLKRLAEIV
jgi:CRP/FNR family transcriptional regulator, cyclic AMP receptor protein